MGLEPLRIDEKRLAAIDNRVRRKIINYLAERPYTTTELSNLLHISVPSVKEHLDKLCDAGIVKVQDSDRKWKYYSLTEDGEIIAKSSKKAMPINIVIMFVVVVVGLFILFSLNYVQVRYNPQQPVGPTVSTEAGTGTETGRVEVPSKEEKKETIPETKNLVTTTTTVPPVPETPILNETNETNTTKSTGGWTNGTSSPGSSPGTRSEPRGEPSLPPSISGRYIGEFPSEPPAPPPLPS